MADLTRQDLTDEDGGAVTFTAASAGGDQFVWSSVHFVMIKNDDASAKQVTIPAATTSFDDSTRGELTRSDIVLSVAAGAVAIIPPLPSPFRDTADGNKVSLTYDAVTSLSVAVVRAT